MRRIAFNIANSHDLYEVERCFPDMKIVYPSAEDQASAQQREIARMLSVPEDVLAERIALNAANPNMKSAGYVSLQVNRADGSLNPKVDSYTPIPEGISAKSKTTLTQDAVSDILTLRDIAWQLGIDPAEFAQRLADDAKKREAY
jgi:hypothetical protein